MVARVWRKHELNSHRIERYMASNDLEFEKKAADIIGLYLNPPAYATVFCVSMRRRIFRPWIAKYCQSPGAGLNAIVLSKFFMARYRSVPP
jgi:hypothetical protein